MELETAIRTRRTHKVFGAEPVPAETLRELIELATWAPNHHSTNPWRFRLLGPDSLERLKLATGPEGASKLDRAPTLIAVTSLTNEDAEVEEEDLLATGSAVYALLLAAHARGFATYWRTPGVLRTPEGRQALGIPDNERFVALVHLGPMRQDALTPERAPLGEILTTLD
jgi:nitroreductase